MVTGSRRTSGARNVCSERRYSPSFSLLLPFALFSSMASATVTYSGLSKFILSPFRCFYTFVCGKEDSNMYCKKRLHLSHWLKTLPKHSLSQMHLWQFIYLFIVIYLFICSVVINYMIPLCCTDFQIRCSPLQTFWNTKCVNTCSAGFVPAVFFYK